LLAVFSPGVENGSEPGNVNVAVFIRPNFPLSDPANR
jgi:hypothetical protein